ncbi:helix-turn-helix domain-containing protein [Actinomadura viridis]|uniref:helix-turn-helix domain-containing protein n=1 Tax=Actinomadura viridis TaxID=58110 RepID=UPI0036BECFDD
MHDEITIGARIRALRRWRGMSLDELAGLSGLSKATLSRMENGKLALDRRSHISAIASALRVSETDLVGGPHLSQDPVQSGPHAAIPALRVALQTNTLTDAAADRARPVAELRRVLDEVVLPSWRTADYMSMGAEVPDLIDELHHHVAAPADEAVHRAALSALIDALHFAYVLGKNLNYMDLAHVAASRATDAANLLGDPVQLGKAKFQLVLSAPREGSWRRVLDLAEKAANDLQPYARDELGVQVLGMSTLNVALAAAALNDADSARHWLAEAEELARRVPDAPLKAWMAFSATNVKLWQIAIGVELGQSSGEIAKVAQGVNPTKLDALPYRKSGFFADTGRALARDPKTRADATRWLLRAEEAAPQFARNNPRIRESIAVMLEQARIASQGRELRGMAARMGLPH